MEADATHACATPLGSRRSAFAGRAVEGRSGEPAAPYASAAQRAEPLPRSDAFTTTPSSWSACSETRGVTRKIQRTATGTPLSRARIEWENYRYNVSSPSAPTSSEPHAIERLDFTGRAPGAVATSAVDDRQLLASWVDRLASPHSRATSPRRGTLPRGARRARCRPAHRHGQNR